MENQYIDDAIESLKLSMLNLLKESLEGTGIDFGETKNDIEYKNYLADKPIVFNKGKGNYTLSDFEGAGAGKLTIPNDFYSDQVLYSFLSNAEGNVGLQWVTSFKGDSIATNCGIGGWDFPGGVHSPGIAKAIGVSPSDFSSWVKVNKASGFSRRAIGGELKEGAAWGWATDPVQSDNPYWKKLIPYYRDQMIWAWNQPGIQAIKDPAERLARMHTINWFGYHYMRGLSSNDAGWNHRLSVAKGVCGNMGYFS